MPFSTSLRSTSRKELTHVKNAGIFESGAWNATLPDPRPLLSKVERRAGPNLSASIDRQRVSYSPLCLPPHLSPAYWAGTQRSRCHCVLFVYCCVRVETLRTSEQEPASAIGQGLPLCLPLSNTGARRLSADALARSPVHYRQTRRGFPSPSCHSRRVRGRDESPLSLPLARLPAH